MNYYLKIYYLKHENYVRTLVIINRKLIAIGFVIILIPAIFIYDYTQNNPLFCQTCHLMNNAYDSWSVSAMHDLNCHECHESNLGESLGHVVEVLVVDPNTVSKETEIDNKLCEHCHASEDPLWLQVVNTAGHKVHFYTPSDHADCIDCHGLRLHTFEPPEETCMECHEESKGHAEEIMTTHCVNCHVFTVISDELLPEDRACLECHEGKDVMGLTFPPETHTNNTCKDCHNPHVDYPYPDCTECHEKGKELHSIQAHDECLNCHIPHSEKQMRSNCESCHIDKTEHFAHSPCSSCHTF
jgi:hypothetical protein